LGLRLSGGAGGVGGFCLLVCLAVWAGEEIECGGGQVCERVVRPQWLFAALAHEQHRTHRLAAAVGAFR